MRALLRSLRTIFTKRYGRPYLRFLLWCARRHPSKFSEAVRLGIQGFHFEAITREALACDAIRHDSTRAVERIAAVVRRLRSHETKHVRIVVAERTRVLRQLRRRIDMLAPDTRAAAAKAYADVLRRVNDLVTEHVPQVAETIQAGARRLEDLRISSRHDVDRIRTRYMAVRERAGRNVDELSRGLQSIYRRRRDTLKRARRQVRRLPAEYRPLGVLELQILHQRLDDLLPRPAAVPVLA
jgi:hypothetical protein